MELFQRTKQVMARDLYFGVYLMIHFRVALGDNILNLLIPYLITDNL